MTITVKDKVSIIGESGQGKSTFLSLFCRFYDVDDGEVIINGKNIKSIPNEELKKMFGVVFQNDTIFNDSVYENISFGRDIPFDVVEKACEYACAKEFIEKLEYKYQTILSPKGTNISGGQKQRLLIARSLAGNPDILILDDATSALDLKTEAEFYRRLGEENPGLTKVIVAQRVSSIKNADKIMILDGGTIADIGTHEELMKNCSVYREIAQSQLTAAELA